MRDRSHSLPKGARRALMFTPTALALLALSGCAHSQWQRAEGGRDRVEADGTEVRRAIVENKTEGSFASRTEIDDVARYLAGLPGGRGSPLTPYREQPEWALHTNNLNELWRRFDSIRRAPIDSWASRELGSLRSPRVLFYPFSGPDFLCADAFFPGAKTTILCGLESSEPLPSLAALTDEQREEGLRGLYTSLTSSLSFSFFITKDMRVDLQRTEFKGTLPIVLTFLARGGHHIGSLEAVSLDGAGRVVARGSGPIHGFRIRLDAGRTVYYFTTDLSNDSFAPRSAFAEFVRSQGAVVSFTKSASYLMHERGFSAVRDFVLDQSTAVLQDDSGVPLQAFAPDRWVVSHYGRYSGVLGMFSKYYQADLAAAHEAGTAPLGFGIGYKHQEGQSAMILARKR